MGRRDVNGPLQTTRILWAPHEGGGDKQAPRRHVASAISLNETLGAIRCRPEYAVIQTTGNALDPQGLLTDGGPPSRAHSPLYKVERMPNHLRCGPARRPPRHQTRVTCAGGPK